MYLTLLVCKNNLNSRISIRTEKQNQATLPPSITLLTLTLLLLINLLLGSLNSYPEMSVRSQAFFIDYCRLVSIYLIQLSDLRHTKSY